MKYQLISLYLLLFGLIMITGCKKSANTVVANNNSVVGQHEKTTEEGKVVDDLARQLMIQYGMVELTPEQVGLTEFPTFSDFDSASAYVKKVQQAILESYSGSATTQTSMFPPTVESKFADPVPPGGCRSPATYFANLAGSGGLFSTFRTAFTFNGTGITGASVYVTGMPIGWTWRQVGTTFTGNSTSGCVYGTITYGIKAGNLTLGITHQYHFSFNYNPVGCLLYYRQGDGSC